MRENRVGGTAATRVQEVCEAAYRVASRRLPAPTIAYAVTLRAEEPERRGAWALGERYVALGECRGVRVWSETRNVMRVWRVAYRAVRWLRGLDASAERKRPQRSDAAL